jgi:sulfite reductase beta subunit-like hemoprotein
MLRVAVPYGELSSTQLRALARIAREFDQREAGTPRARGGFGHFSTRQNLQFNWIPLDESADVMDLLAAVDMHGIQTSGNCIRNITTDALAGIAPDEEIDPRPYCEILRQWSTLHPEFAFLPRKFKIAITGATSDRAAILVHDIGLQAVRGHHGAIGFRVAVGGGLGRREVVVAGRMLLRREQVGRLVAQAVDVFLQLLAELTAFIGFQKDEAGEADRIRRQTRAGAMVLTSQGVPFLHAGEMVQQADPASRKLSDFALEYECARGAIAADEEIGRAHV